MSFYILTKNINVKWRKFHFSKSFAIHGNVVHAYLFRIQLCFDKSMVFDRCSLFLFDDEIAFRLWIAKFLEWLCRKTVSTSGLTFEGPFNYCFAYFGNIFRQFFRFCKQLITFFMFDNINAFLRPGKNVRENHRRFFRFSLP